jgi:hypothetical protein
MHAVGMSFVAHMALRVVIGVSLYEHGCGCACMSMAAVSAAAASFCCCSHSPLCVGLIKCKGGRCWRIWSVDPKCDVGYIPHEGGGATWLGIALAKRVVPTPHQPHRVLGVSAFATVLLWAVC